MCSPSGDRWEGEWQPSGAGEVAALSKNVEWFRLRNPIVEEDGVKKMKLEFDVRRFTYALSLPLLMISLLQPRFFVRPAMGTSVQHSGDHKTRAKVPHGHGIRTVHLPRAKQT